MEKVKKKLIINYILLFLILIIVAILVVPIEWIANHVPSGVLGLLIFMGYLLCIYMVFRFLILKVGPKLIDAEQELEGQKYRTSINKFDIFKKENFPEDVIKLLISNKFQVSEKSVEVNGNSITVRLLYKKCNEGFVKMPTCMAFAFILDLKMKVNISVIADKLRDDINESLDIKEKRTLLKLSICFISNKIETSTVKYCLSNTIDNSYVYVPIACEMSSGKMYYRKDKKGFSKLYGKHIDLIKKVFLLK